MNTEVSDYIAHISQPWQVEICTKIRNMIQEQVPDIEERIQYGKPHFLLNGSYAFVLSTAKDWVTLLIFNAKNLEAPSGFFEYGKTDRKLLRIPETRKLDYDLLKNLIKTVITNY